MHSYGKREVAARWPTEGRMRERNPQSAALWSYHHRPSTVGDIVFDTASMVPTPVCAPHGVWTAKARHGQAVLHQHPRQWHRQTLVPGKTDIAVDSAQLAVLLQQGAGLADVAAACERQEGACEAEEGWAKVLTSGDTNRGYCGSHVRAVHPHKVLAPTQ